MILHVSLEEDIKGERSKNHLDRDMLSAPSPTTRKLLIEEHCYRVVKIRRWVIFTKATSDLPVTSLCFLAGHIAVLRCRFHLRM